MFFIPDDSSRNIAHQITFLINLSSSYLAFFYFKNDDRLYFDYRKRIIPVLLKRINSTYKYYPRAKILAKEFVESGLYYNKVSRLERKDLILGMVHRAAFSMSFVRAQTKEFIGRSGITGTSNSTLVTRFQGLHYVMKIPVSFSGKTIILPLAHSENQELNEVNQHNLSLRSSKKGSKRIVTGNEHFDSEFAVFTSHEKDAIRFLNNKRIADILEINRLFRNTVAISFFSSIVYLHVHTNTEVFKLNLSQPIDVQQVSDNYLNLLIALKAVHLLLD